MNLDLTTTRIFFVILMKPEICFECKFWQETKDLNQSNLGLVFKLDL